MSALLSPEVRAILVENFSCFPNAARVLYGLIHVAATPPIMDVFKNLRRENVVMTIGFWYKQTYKN
jgi:hypothetical protein